MFKYVKDVSASCVYLITASAAIIVGFELGGKLVEKINNKKEQKEKTPEIEEAQ